MAFSKHRGRSRIVDHFRCDFYRVTLCWLWELSLR